MKVSCLREMTNNMYLYHGSAKKFSKLKRQQAFSPAGRPPEEGRNAIYLTPDFAFALISGARPEGITEVNHNARTVRFENPEKFDQRRKVYIYFINPFKIPKDKIIWIDERQVAVDLDEIEPDRVEIHYAIEVVKYYKIDQISLQIYLPLALKLMKQLERLPLQK